MSHHKDRHDKSHHKDRHIDTLIAPLSVTRKSHRVEGFLSLAAVGMVVLTVAAVLVWDLMGGRLFVMETSSMCPTVCVGSLVADRPLHGALHVGDLITFYTSKGATETHTHLVDHIFPNGTIQTRGVAESGHDPWLITRSDIIGKGVFTVWGLGWLLKTLPLLTVGVLFWVLSRAWVTAHSRRAFDRMWITVLTVLPLWLLHPLIRVEVLSIGSDPTHLGKITGTIVNSGLLPIAFNVVGDSSVTHVPSSALRRVTWPTTIHGNLMFHEKVSLSWWEWVILALIVLSPMTGYLWHTRRGNEVVRNVK